jgi:sarcosine oxidase
VLLEPEGGVLRAQRAVRALAAAAVRHGARIVRGRARPNGGAAVLDDSTRLEADVLVWACGPWLARLFPDLVSLSVTRQELLFFDGGPAWRAPDLPGWCDYDRARYGTADVDGLGVKAAIDDLGPPLDPDAELTDEAATEPQVRAYLRERFPALEHASLVEARSSRYEITPDTHFIAAPHPEHASVWLLGGGSGHGFKHGPPMAERLARALREGTPLPDRFRLGERQPSASMRTASSGVAR